MKKIRAGSEVIGMVLAATGIFMFSAKAVLVKIAYRYEIDAVSLLLLRMLFSMPVYLIIAWISARKPTPQKVRKKDYLNLVFLGFVGYYLASYFDFQGLKYISASLERLILFAYPTMVVFISAVVFRNRISRNQWLAIIITYIGIAITFIPDVNHDAYSNVTLGSTLIFLSAFTYAVYIIGSGNLIPKFGSVNFTALTMTVSCFCVIAHHVAVNGFQLQTYPVEVYIIGFLMAFFSTVIPSFLISEAIRKIGSSNFAIIGSLGPVSTIILTVIFINEQITIYHVVGTIAVIGGIGVLQVKPAQENNG